jgi:hypothetical protein
MCHTSLSDKAEQSDISFYGSTNGVEWQKKGGGETETNISAISLLSQALQCADNRQVQHTKIHQFTGDRTAKTKHGNQYRLQFQAFYVMFCSRYSCGGADQLILSRVLGTLDSGPSALSVITEHEMLLPG